MPLSTGGKLLQQVTYSVAGAYESVCRPQHDGTHKLAVSLDFVAAQWR